MKKSLLAALSLAALSLGGCATYDTMNTPTSARNTSYVGGAAMYSNKTIAENAVNAPNLSTLVTAVKAAGLVDTLNSAGPFTVFAPTNDAFNRLPAGTVNNLLMPQNKAMLTKVLTYHVVPGRITAADIMGKIRANGGTATYTTVEGETLSFHMDGSNVMVMGMGGSSAYVTQADVMQSNGVVHVINGVLMPSM